MVAEKKHFIVNHVNSEHNIGTSMQYASDGLALHSSRVPTQKLHIMFKFCVYHPGVFLNSIK